VEESADEQGGIAVSRRPLIGYATRSGVTSPGYAAPRFANNESYARAIADAGGAPLMIPSITDDEALAALYETLDGLLLTGGPDLDPARYGHERHPRTDGGDAAMEHAEVYLAQRALRDGLPIFGICRGIQTLNVVAGGTLYQDVADELRTPITHPADANGRDYRAHEVRITEGTRLGRAVGRTEIKVNSLHHQAVRDVAPGFMAVAEAPDGVVEAIENPALPFAVGVQWHPEELYRADDSAANLFRAFVAAAARHRAERERS
jgi:putative glutamine amidotransferase